MKTDALRPFVPAPGLANAHLQTMWQSAFRRFVRVPTHHEVWELPDGEWLDIELLPELPDRPGALVVHGLESNSAAPYVRGMMRALRAARLNGAALNLRGCGPSGLRGPLTYHSGLTGDVDFAIRQLLERWPSISLIGFSLGANLILKWLGEQGGSSAASCAVAISPPYDLATTARLVDADGFWPAAYRAHFIRPLKRKALRLARKHPGVLETSAVRAARTFREFDSAVTVPLHGFDSVEHYWETQSCGAWLESIGRPTLLVSAEDDPLIPGTVIPEEKIRANDALALWRTQRGGHVGWVSGNILRPRFPVEQAAVGFLLEELEEPHSARAASKASA